MLVASVAANGSYWPCAAHFSVGHGAALCSALRAQLLMRIRMAVLRPLALLWVPHTRTTRLVCCAFQWRVVVQMTNLRDGISKGSTAACYTDLRACFACVRQRFGSLGTLFGCVFFFGFCQNLTVRFLKPQQRVITRFCPTSLTIEATQRSHTTLLTTFLHSTNCKNFAGVPPNNKFQHAHKFRYCKRKLSNTPAAPFLSICSSPKPLKPQQITIAVHYPRSQHTAMGAQPHES